MTVAERRPTSRPLGAVVSQAVVAGSSLLLQIIALDRLGTAGLGTFSLLFGILITINAVQSGWLGDSLTVLDRFEPGIRRALVQSQLAIVVLVAVVATGLALLVDGVGSTTAILFGFASVAWVVEETIRRLLIARREFWKLVANDAAFAVGAFGLVGFAVATGATFTVETLVLALLAGAVVAVGVGVVQLPRVELSRGITAASRLRDVASFAVWRAAQVGLRPGSLAVVRAIVAAAVSLEALGRLETARLLLAPVLTVVNGAGVYLLPTYSAQARAGRPFRPVVAVAMALVGGVAAAYGLVALVLRDPLLDLLTDGTTVVSAAAILAWTAYSVGFGAGVPAGNALVARGRSRTAFRVRVVDAASGVASAGAFALLGWVDLVPLGLALGTFLGAAGLAAALRSLPVTDAAMPRRTGRGPDDTGDPPDGAGDVLLDRLPELTFEPSGATTGTVTVPRPRAREVPAASPRTPAEPGPGRTSGDRRRERLVWLVPLILIVATEYKFRRREIDDALGGSIDLMIAVELGVYALVGIWAVWWLAPTRPRLTPLTVLMWGYVLTTAASALYSTYALLAMARAVQLVVIAAAVHVLAVDGRLRSISRLLHGWVVLLTVSIVAGLAYVAPTTPAQEGRFTWLFVHSVSAGSMLALSVPMLFGSWLSARSRRPRRIELPWAPAVYATLLAVHVAFLLLTRTRGSIGGAAVAVAVMAWMWSGQRMKPQLVLGGLVALGASALAFGGPLAEFLTRGESVDSISTFNRRTEIWTLAWQEFLAHPLHGLGFTSAQGVFFDETGLGGAHNAVVNVMIDAGLVGLLWWLALLGATVVAIGRLAELERVRPGLPGAVGSLRADRIVLTGAMTATLVNSITTEGLGAGVNVSAIWLFVVVAWICVVRRAADERSTNTAVAARVGDDQRPSSFAK